MATITTAGPGQHLDVEQKVQRLRELYADAPAMGKAALEKGLPDLKREFAASTGAQSAGRVAWQQGLDLIALHHAFGAPNRCIGRKGLRLTQHRDALVVTGRVIAKVLASEWSLKIAQWMDSLTRPENRAQARETREAHNGRF